MKIALCTGSFVKGGVGSSLRILCAGMQAAGHQCDIVTTSYKLGNDYERGIKEGWPIKVFCAGERWFRKRLEITLEHLSEYDVVINNHSTETQLLFPALPASIVRMSVIRSTNEGVITQGKADSPYLDALVGISPEVQRLLNKAGVVCRAEMIANAVTLTLTDNLPKLQQPVELAYLGRLTNIDKNILILPEIVEACRKRDLDCFLTVAGDGADLEKLEKKVQDYRLADAIRLVGAISRDKVGSFLSKRSFGLFPSNYEGFGLALVEAMEMGCVPIASDIPAFRWILGEDAKALVAPVKNAGAYAERIRILATDPDHYREIQDRLQRRQRKNFSPEITVRGYLRLIENLRKHRDEELFLPVTLANLPLSKYQKRRCTRAWWFLQKIKYGLRK